MFADPVPIVSEPLFSTATVVWRHAGVLYVTAIAKRSFHLDIAAGARAIRPAPVVRAEVDAGYGRIWPDEVAPCLVGGEVWVVGSVRARPPTANVALRVVRGGAELLARRVAVAVDGSGRAGLGGLGPLSRRWPARAARLGRTPAASLEGPLIAIGDAVDWRYFHAAPAEQIVPWLAPGDEVAVELGGIGALRLVLPLELPVASLAEPARAADGFELRPDTVAFDVDASVVHVVYRGRAALDGDPRRARVDVRLGAARPVEPIATRASVPDLAAAAPELQGTAQLSEDEVTALRAKFALPFRAAKGGAPAYEPPPAPPSPSVDGSTVAADEREIAELRARYLPFGKSAAASPPLPLAPPAPSPAGPPPPASTPTPVAPPASLLGTPPVAVASATVQVAADELADLRARYATPFEKPSAKLARARPVPPAKSTAAAPAPQSGQTSVADAAEVAKLRELHAPAFFKDRADKAAAAPPAPGEPSKPGSSAGASFLEALGDEDEPR